MFLPIIDSRDRRRAALVAAAVAALLCSTAAADAATVNPHAKHAYTKLAATDERTAIDVKFTDGSDVRLQGDRLLSAGKGRIAALDQALGRFEGLQFSRLFASASVERLAAVRREARARSGRTHADLNLYFRIRTRSAADSLALLNALQKLDIVESATPVAKPAPPPVTPSYEARQGYRTAAAYGGIDADFAQTVAGGKGENVTVVDVEYSWNRSHEDLAKARAAGFSLPNGTACTQFNTDHGTAVLGELSGDPNGLGVTGLVPGARVRTVNAASRNSAGACVWNPANAILIAADNTAPGDVILLEQQIGGPRFPGGDTQFGYLPIEWVTAVRAAIQNATARGRIVVEAAGNGSQNLDDPFYGGYFSVDSGAIMVGAGNAPGCQYGSDPMIARSRLSFSNYGARLNVQGWGACVTTTGYGGLQGGPDGNNAYTKTFGGTSSASPIVAASAAALSSVAKARGMLLSPASVRSTLRATGQPQTYGNAGAIGPLPNLRAAIGTLGASLPQPAEASHVISGSIVAGSTVQVRQSWSNSGGAAVAYEVWLSTDGGAWVKQATTASAGTFNLQRNHSYRFAARAMNAAGAWSAFAYGTTFQLGQYQENYAVGNPAYSGTWTRAAWAPASDGFLSVSSTAGSRASFTFTGSSVAWIATRATNRGQARVYVDGLLAGTVDLYSATTSAQSIAFSRSWSAVGTAQDHGRGRGHRRAPEGRRRRVRPAPLAL